MVQSPHNYVNMIATEQGVCSNTLIFISERNFLIYIINVCVFGEETECRRKPRYGC